ncbi:MAG: hypothetical protein AB1480_02105 [Nitrospirota bacterium]
MMKSLQEFLKWFKRRFKKDKVHDKESAQAVSDQKIERSKIEEPALRKEVTPRAIIRRKEKVYIQVGLDFGTSATKIAYSQLGGRGRKVNPILFNHNLPHYPPYCLPSLAAFDETGKLLLGIEAARFLADKPWDSGLRRFKVIVAGKYDKSFDDQISIDLYRKYLTQISLNQSDCEPECLTAVFLAFAMKQARHEMQRKFSECELDMAFNTCIPIDHIQNNEVNNVYQKILATAENAEKDNDCNKLLEIVREKYKNVEYRSMAPRLFGVPEAVAEIALYLVSLQVRNGLHAVIDFGAGTTDFSIFYLENIRTRDEQKFWYAARNLPRGSQRIEYIVSRYMGEISKGENITDLHVAHATSNINKLPDDIKNQIRKELKGLWEDSHAVWGQAYSHRRRQSEWEGDRVHVLVCGGGAKAPFIKDIFSKSWMKDWGPYPVYPLPIPDDYDSLDGKASFERMSVAYGLCQPLPSLGDYTLPNDAPDQTPPRLPIREMSEWDERIPRPGWIG